MTKKKESLSVKKGGDSIEENAKTSNQKYIQNQQRLRQILDLVPHMIFLKDYDGKVLMANKACSDFYNIDTKQLVYKNIEELHDSKEELKRILLEDQSVINNKKRIELDNVTLTDSSGEKRVYKSTKIPFTDPLTQKIGSLGISIDVTEQKNTEKSENEAKEKYRLLVERGNDGIIILQNEKIVFTNNQAARIFGTDQKEFLNKNITDFIGRTEYKEITENYLLNIKNKQVDSFYE